MLVHILYRALRQAAAAIVRGYSDTSVSARRSNTSSLGMTLRNKFRYKTIYMIIIAAALYTSLYILISKKEGPLYYCFIYYSIV